MWDAIRDLSDRATALSESARRTPGTIEIGSELIRKDITVDVMFHIASRSGVGISRDRITESARELARIWIEKWNKRREYQSRIYDGSFDHVIDWEIRKIPQEK